MYLQSQFLTTNTSSSFSSYSSSVKEIDKIKYLISQYIKNCNNSTNRPYSNRNHYNFKFDSTIISNINQNFDHHHHHHHSNNNNNNNNNNKPNNFSPSTSPLTSNINIGGLTSNNNNNIINNINNNKNANRRKRQMVRRNSIHDITSFIGKKTSDQDDSNDHEEDDDDDDDDETKCRQCSCFCFNNKGITEWLCVCGHSNISHLKLNSKKSYSTFNTLN
ncbi:hypothetical protein ACTFIW_009788 [Dictyostelium discoideum]